MVARDDFAGFGEAEVSSQIAKSVFDNEFKHLQDRLEKQESLSQSVIVGSVVALFFVLAALIWGAWAFIGEYNHDYLNAESNFTSETKSLEVDNAQMQQQLTDMRTTMDKLQTK